MDDVVVSLNNISKCFKRYAHPVERLKETLLRGKVVAEEFWALRSLDMEIRKGETLGILGRNGSGKSTLLQIIAGTLTPTTGTVKVNGRVSALLELGSGFNPEFTGRQNVFFKGRILGLSQVELERKFADIVAFADIGDFIDQPVKTYSSGMFVRLAFAVAIHVEPEILIVDEALAVGDIFFQQKCFRCLEQMRANGVSIIFVSHDLQAVTKLCDRVAILDKGHLEDTGSPSDMVGKFVQMFYGFSESEAVEIVEESSLMSDEPVVHAAFAEHAETSVVTQANITTAQIIPQTFISDFSKCQRYGLMNGLIAGLSLTTSTGKLQLTYPSGTEVFLTIKVNQHSTQIYPLNMGFQIKNRMGQIFIGTNTCLLRKKLVPSQPEKPFICQFKLRLLIAPGQYTISPAIAEFKPNAQIIYDWIENAASFEVISEDWPQQVGLCCPDVDVVIG
ncbi:MAG: ABC transporter ATP-binding protein [Leptolyngbyaceae cyanobacterium bins.349]|nr:ABC transporter ATP-binding protein [Leptolyngbyaceae cyanobacterium bins.349]